VTGVIFGLIPALRGTGFDFQHALKDASYTTSEGSKRRFIRNGLIVGEVGLAAVLLVASLLVVKSLWKLTHVDPGFNAANVLSIRIVTPQQHTASREESTAYRLELIRRVAEVPGVISAGASKTLPLQGGGEPYGFVYKSARGDVTVKPEAGVFVASPGYFKALQIPLICGRVFTEQDNAPNASPVLLVNQALASRIWPGEDPVGKALSLGNASATIVGVIGNVRSEGLSSEPRGAIYGPMGIFPRSSLYIFARTDGNPLAIASGVRQAIWNYEKNQAIDMAPLQGSLEADVAQPRYFTLLLGTFGTMALVLAGIGIYGVISYNVHQQLREIGIRMALGAQPSQVLSMVLGGAIRLAGIGLVLGTVVALVASRALRSLLFGVSAVDSSMYALMILVLMSVALLASYVPARRATKVDPMVALRYE
jgi:putative ABC transport system permease protein